MISFVSLCFFEWIHWKPLRMFVASTNMWFVIWPVVIWPPLICPGRQTKSLVINSCLRKMGLTILYPIFCFFFTFFSLAVQIVLTETLHIDGIRKKIFYISKPSTNKFTIWENSNVLQCLTVIRIWLERNTCKTINLINPQVLTSKT